MCEKCYSLHLIESRGRNYETYDLYQELYVMKRVLEPSSVTSKETELIVVRSLHLAGGSEGYLALGVDFVGQRAFLPSWRQLGLQF